LFLILLNRQTGFLTQLILIPWIIQFGLLLSSWCIVIRDSSEVQKHQPSETSPEQLLGRDQPSTNQQQSATDQRLLLVVHSHGGHTEHHFC